jgi:hypothetical protein
MPFQANHEFEWIIAVAGNMEEQAPRLRTVCPRVSTGLEDILAKGLQKKISNRYTNAMEMRVAVQQFEHDRFTRPSHWTPSNPVNECRSSQ